MELIKSFCGGPGGGFLEKSPLVAEGKKKKNNLPGTILPARYVNEHLRCLILRSLLTLLKISYNIQSCTEEKVIDR